MKHFKRLVTYAAAIAFASIDIALSQPADSASSYFPLQIGIQWTFASCTKTLADTTNINGRSYYEMNTSYGSSSYPTWFRSSHDTVYVMNLFIDSIESPIYYLNARLGESMAIRPKYVCDYGSAAVLAGKEDTVITPAGTYLHCLHFIFGPGCPDGGMTDTWLAKGFGEVKLTNESIAGPRTNSLISCTFPTSARQIKTDGASGSMLEYFVDHCDSRVTFAYRIDKDAYVSLALFNMLGRRIAHLVSGPQTIGNYRVSWTAKGMPGNAYIAVFTSNSISVTRNLILY